MPSAFFVQGPGEDGFEVLVHHDHTSGNIQFMAGDKLFAYLDTNGALHTVAVAGGPSTVGLAPSPTDATRVQVIND